MQHQTHWVPARFRCLSDEQIGIIQHRLIDLKERAADVAGEFEVSSVTIYRVKNAVPLDLVHVDEVTLRRLRLRAKQRKRRKVS